MRVVSKEELRRMLTNNKIKYVIAEYTPCVMGEPFVTDSTFGANPLYSTSGDLSSWDWDLNANYNKNQQFVVFEASDIGKMMAMLSDSFFSALDAE